MVSRRRESLIAGPRRTLELGPPPREWDGDEIAELETFARATDAWFSHSVCSTDLPLAGAVLVTPTELSVATECIALRIEGLPHDIISGKRFARRFLLYEFRRHLEKSYRDRGHSFRRVVPTYNTPGGVTAADLTAFFFASPNPEEGASSGSSLAACRYRAFATAGLDVYVGPNVRIWQTFGLVVEAGGGAIYAAHECVLVRGSRDLAIISGIRYRNPHSRMLRDALLGEVTARGLRFRLVRPRNRSTWTFPQDLLDAWRAQFPEDIPPEDPSPILRRRGANLPRRL